MEYNRKKIKMPIVRPVQYATKKCNVFKRFWRWAIYTRRWMLVEDWYYILPNGVKIVIPKGFITDGASVPKVLRSLLSPVGILYIPGIIHDFAYKYNKLIEVTPDGIRYDYKVNAGRIYYDELFCETAEDVNGMIIVDRVSFYVLVVFGSFTWKNYRKILQQLSVTG
jgi:hypothetical protein